MVRNNKEIRKDRAESIIEDAQTLYQREVQDLDLARRKKVRDRDSMLDLSPTTALSLTLASDFDAKEYVAKDMTISLEIRELDIKLEIAKERYTTLFGEEL